MNFLSPKITRFGIDLSDLSVKIVSLKKEKRGFSLDCFGRKEIKAGLIEEGEIKKEEELIQTIKQAIKEIKGSPIKTEHCIVSLPETESFVEVISMPLMEEEELAGAIKWEIEAHIPLPQEDIYYDWQIISREKDHVNILIGALPKKTVDPYLAVLTRAGLKPSVFEIESIATARALIKKDDKEASLIVDIGAKRTAMAIASSRSVYFTTSIHFSNSSIVATLASKLGINPEEAKKIKIERGLGDGKEQSPELQALKPHFFELMEKIKECIFYYTDRCPVSDKEILKKIILCGGGANLSGLAQFLSGELGMETEIGNPLGNIELANSNPAIPKEELTAYTTALGLALIAAE